MTSFWVFFFWASFFLVTAFILALQRSHLCTPGAAQLWLLNLASRKVVPIAFETWRRSSAQERQRMIQQTLKSTESQPDQKSRAKVMFANFRVVCGVWSRFNSTANARVPHMLRA